MFLKMWKDTNKTQNNGYLWEEGRSWYYFVFYAYVGGKQGLRVEDQRILLQTQS